jgi:hypothetical protein
MTTTPHAGPVPDLDLAADDEIYGPQFPDEHDLHRAQDRPLEAGQAGCSEAEYQRLVQERQQTELAYLAGYDRDLIASRPEAGAEADWEAEAG